MVVEVKGVEGACLTITPDDHLLVQQFGEVQTFPIASIRGIQGSVTTCVAIETYQNETLVIDCSLFPLKELKDFMKTFGTIWKDMHALPPSKDSDIKILFKPFLLPGAVLLSTFGLGFLYLAEHVPYPLLRRALWSGWMWALVLQLRNRLIVPCAILPSVFISQLRRGELHQLREQHRSLDPQRIRFVSLPTVDGVELDGVEVVSESTIPPAAQKWIVWFNPNAATWEDEFPFLYKYATHLQVNLLAFNYRGVGLSQGSPKTAWDLVRDGEAALQALIRRGVPPTQILLHGHSMGGAVATHTRLLFPEGPLVNDRSFRSIGSVVAGLIKAQPPLGIALGTLLGGGAGLWGSLLGEVPLGSLLGYTFASAVTLGFVGKAAPKIVIALVQGMLNLVGWHFDVVKAWHKVKGPKRILFHKMDGIISHNVASLAVLMETTPEHIMPLQHTQRDLTDPDQFYHCYPLDALPSEWDTFLRVIGQLLQKTS